MIEEEFNKDQAIIKEVEKLVSFKMFERINYEIKESCDTVNFRFEDKPEGEKQKDPELNIWVDQYTCGCGAGDCFHGSVYIELPNKKWLVWDYST